MKFSERINRAIVYATQQHEGQYRKDLELPSEERVPYITHPRAVAAIVAGYTDDEDVIIAALFHDILEDVYEDIEKYPHAHDEMIEKFGDRVYEIVKGVSEKKDSKMSEQQQIASWMERKKEYIEHLKRDSKESLLVACADKIHNLKSLCSLYESSLDKTVALKSFHAPEAPMSKELNILWYYKEVLKVLKMKLKNQIVEEMAKKVQELEKTFK